MFEAFGTLIEKQGMEAIVPLMRSQPMTVALRESHPEIAEAQERILAQANPIGAAHAIRGLLGGPPLPVKRFADIDIPALIIAHEGDPIHPMASAKLLEEALPQARLHTAPSLVHFIEHPEEMLGVIGEFLEELDTP